jgi:nicotinamide-nucleotide adenylyltransferase
MRAMLLGRFQPFHNGHAKVVEWAFDRYESLVLIIGSPQDSYTYTNPFTGGERYLMIQTFLKDKGYTDWNIVPVPDIHRYGVYASHVADFAPPFDIVLTNKELIKLIFEEEGCTVESMPEFDRNLLSGTEVRQRMATGNDWQSLVPEVVAEIIHDIGGVQRVQELYGIEQ